MRSTPHIVATLLCLAAALSGAESAKAQDTLPARVLSLGDAARLAARQGALSVGARYRAEQAEARVTQSRADLFPSISASGLHSARTFNTATLGLNLPDPATGQFIFPPNGEVLGPVTTIDLRARASQTILDLGALGRVRQARAEARASGADAADAAEQAAASAAAAYLRAAHAQAQLSARVADSVLADSLLGIARAQLSAGVGVGLDVTRAESQLAGVRAQLIAARNERDRAQLVLTRALGLPLDTPVELRDSLGAIPAGEPVPSEAEAVAAALEHRPDLRAAAEQLAAAQAGIAAIRAERLPSLAVFGDDGLTSSSYAHLMNTYMWGIQLSVPILDGFRRQGRVAEQEARSREVDVRLRDLREQTAAEVRGALLDLASAREQVAAARERLRLSQQEVAQARDRFRAGVASNADVISASVTLNSARTLVVEALTAYQTARVELARSQGTVTALP